MAVLCAVVALAQDAGAAAQSQGQPAAQQGQRTDGQIEMDVVHALDASAALKNDLITAATIQGEVTLSGTVSSDASKQLAESIAAHVDGVTKVHNNLQIGNPGQDAQDLQPAPDTGGDARCRPVAGAKENGGLAAAGPCSGSESARIKARLQARRPIRNSRRIRSKAAIRRLRRHGRSTRVRSTSQYPPTRSTGPRLRRLRISPPEGL